MHYFDNLLSYIINNPKLSILLILIIFAGIVYLFNNKKRISKYKKVSNLSTNTNNSNILFNKRSNKHYIQIRNTQPTKTIFVVESVSQVFKNKTQIKSR